LWLNSLLRFVSLDHIECHGCCWLQLRLLPSVLGLCRLSSHLCTYIRTASVDWRSANCLCLSCFLCFVTFSIIWGLVCPLAEPVRTRVIYLVLFWSFRLLSLPFALTFPDASVCPEVVQEDVILSLLEAQLSVISVGILPETMMYITVLSLLSVLLPYTVLELLSIGPTFPFEYTTLHISSSTVG
jgi:hypothetical protein